MPAKSSTAPDGFSAAERAAMKKRAEELRAEGKAGTEPGAAPWPNAST